MADQARYCPDLSFMKCATRQTPIANHFRHLFRFVGACQSGVAVGNCEVLLGHPQENLRSRRLGAWLETIEMLADGRASDNVAQGVWTERCNI